MALFSFGKDRREEGLNQLVLAYLEDAQRVRCSFTFKPSGGSEASGVVQSLNEEEGTFSLQLNGAPTLEKGAKARVLFILEGVRLGAAVRIAGTRAGLVDVEIPEELELLERRKFARARLNPREGATVTALTGLFEGIGVSGSVENLSQGGLRMRVDKAMNIQGEKRLPLGSSLLPVGQPLMLVKLNKVPKCPSVMELTGRVAYVDASSGLCLGISFEKPRQDFDAAIRNLVSSRSAPVPTSVPPKNRRSLEPPEESLLPSRPEPHAKPAPEPEEAHVAPPEQPRPAKAAEVAPGRPEPLMDHVPEPTAEEPVPQAVHGTRNVALLKLKKRARTVLVAAAAGPGRDLLVEHLDEEGYGRVLVAGSLGELVEGLRQTNLGALVIDEGLPEAHGLELVGLLQSIAEDLPPILLAVTDVSASYVLKARQAGVAQLIVKPYLMDEAFSATLESMMGLL